MTVLREITNAKHREVEQTPLIQYLMSGAVTAEHYTSYLFELHAIYRTLESAGSSVIANLPGIERSERIAADLSELDSHYNRPLLIATQRYIAYLEQLVANKQTADLILAHIYVRHVGDLYGGKLMARVVPGAGQMYQFDDRPGIIKGINTMLTVELGEEANKAFDYFIAIFNDLYQLMK